MEFFTKLLEHSPDIIKTVTDLYGLTALMVLALAALAFLLLKSRACVGLRLRNSLPALSSLGDGTGWPTLNSLPFACFGWGAYSARAAAPHLGVEQY